MKDGAGFNFANLQNLCYNGTRSINNWLLTITKWKAIISKQ